MSIDMAMFAMVGSLVGASARRRVGASATVATAWFTQKTLSRREFTRDPVSASPAVLAEAERLLRRITEQYFSRNLTLEEMRELALSTEADPLRAFGEACRVELKALRAGM